jgi:hypothetical protein
VAWLGPAFAIAAIGPLCAISVGSISGQADDVAARYEALPAAMARAGVSLDNTAPVITDAPIWLAEAAGVRTLALPEESPSSVVALANRFGARILIVREDTDRQWPQILDGQQPDTKCFQEVPLTDISGHKPANGSPLASIRVYRIVCT